MSEPHRCFVPPWDPRRSHNWECGDCGRLFKPVNPALKEWSYGHYGWVEIRGPREAIA